MHKGTRIVDTNLILRHLLQDNEFQAAKAMRIIAASDRNEVVLVVLPTVLAECVFVLESFYRHTRADISDTLGKLLRSTGVKIVDLAIHLDALERYGTTKLSFVDCLIAATAAAMQAPIATFDAGFKRFADVRVDLDV